MAEQNDSSRGSSSNGGSGFPARTWLVWIAVAALIPLLLFFQKTSQQRYEPISQKRLFELVESNLVQKGSGEINFAPQSQLRLIRGRYLGMEEGKTNASFIPFSVEAVISPERMDKLMDTGVFRPVENNNAFLQLVLGIMPILIIGLLIQVKEVKWRKSGNM
jgi:hypothetical protein